MLQTNKIRMSNRLEFRITFHRNHVRSARTLKKKKNIPRRVTTLESQCCRPQKHTICEPPASQPAPPRMPNIRAWEEFRKEIFVHLTMLQRPAANKNGFHVRTFLARTFRSKWTCLFCGRKGFPPLEKGSTKAWSWPCRVF